MSTRRLVILGAGGHAVAVVDTARAAGFEIVGCLDDDERRDRIGAVADLPRLVAEHGPGLAAHAAVAAPTLRRQWLDVAGTLPAPPVVHPSAIVSPTATLGEGVFVGPRAVVNAHARIGRGVIVNSGVIVEHECVVEAFCHLAPGAILCGSVTVGEGTLIGAGAVVVPNLTIGAGATLGAGAVALTSVAAETTAVGVPAR